MINHEPIFLKIKEDGLTYVINTDYIREIDEKSEKALIIYKGSPLTIEKKKAERLVSLLEANHLVL